MDKHDKRRMAINQIRATAIEVAKKGDTIEERKLISQKKLIGEIAHVYEVSSRTAKDYIDELVNMNVLKREANDDDYMLWYAKEDEVRLQYLSSDVDNKG